MVDVYVDKIHEMVDSSDKLHKATIRGHVGELVMTVFYMPKGGLFVPTSVDFGRLGSNRDLGTYLDAGVRLSRADIQDGDQDLTHDIFGVEYKVKGEVSRVLCPVLGKEVYTVLGAERPNVLGIIGGKRESLTVKLR